MKVVQQTQDWGNSTGIRIPKKVLLTVGWQQSQEVAIDIKGRSIILTPVSKPQKRLAKTYVLDELLEGVTAYTVHEAADWGKPVGDELW